MGKQKDMERQDEYFSHWEKLASGDEVIPFKIGNIPIEGRSRLNRFVLSRGCICVWWDDSFSQLELAASFSPTMAKRFTDRKYPEGREGSALFSIHSMLEEHGSAYFPNISSDEKYVQTWLSLQCSLAEKLGFTRTVRVLSRGERKALLGIHDLKFGASELFINSGVDDLSLQ
jgi:hypothetical protein